MNSTVSNQKVLTFPLLVRTNKLKTGRPSVPGLLAEIICSRMAVISCCLLYIPRICGGTLGFPFFIVIDRAAAFSGRWSVHTRTDPPNAETELPVMDVVLIDGVHADTAVAEKANKIRSIRCSIARGVLSYRLQNIYSVMQAPSCCGLSV